MVTNWGEVEIQLGNKVGEIVGAAWANAKTGATIQFKALIAAGIEIEAKRATMTQTEYESLKYMCTKAFEGVLQTYKGIAFDVAQQAAAAAWGIVSAAIKKAHPALGLIL